MRFPGHSTSSVMARGTRPQLARKLLSVCVMIRGSEKRRLTGREIRNVWDSRKSSGEHNEHVQEISRSHIRQTGTSIRSLTRGMQFVIPSMNLLEDSYV
jgi:predicted secreted Zn-dependent protease